MSQRRYSQRSRSQVALLRADTHLRGDPVPRFQERKTVGSSVNPPFEHGVRWACCADRVFDGERVHAGGAVVIDEERVVSVVPAREIPPEMPRAEQPGCTILPGLIDMHVHFMRWEGPLLLAYGVTTIRDVGNNLDWILARRREWPTNPWPRIYTFGPVLDGSSPLHGNCSRACFDVDSARTAVAETAAAGVDGIKLYVGLPAEWLPGMVGEAHGASLHVAMHCGGASALIAGAAGVDEFFHLDGLLEDIWPDNPGGWLSAWGLPGMADRSALQAEAADRVAEFGMIATPTLAWWDTNWRRVSPEYPTAEDTLDLPQDIVAWQCAECRPDPAAATLWRRALEATQRFVGLLLERDVRVLAGTDLPCGMLTPGLSLWKEMALLVECGMSPVAALQAATSDAAACLKNDRVGRLAAGTSADMIVVRGDPTRGIPADPDVAMVVRAGDVFHPDDLRAQARTTDWHIAGDPWRTQFNRALHSEQAQPEA